MQRILYKRFAPFLQSKISSFFSTINNKIVNDSKPLENILKSFNIFTPIKELNDSRDIKTREAAIIDCGGSDVDVDKFIELAEILKFNLKFCLLTHGHIDHVAGVSHLQSTLKNKHDEKNLKTVMNKNDEKLYFTSSNQLFGAYSIPTLPKIDILLDNNNTDEFKLGDLSISAIHTPGHTKGSTCYYIPNISMLFTGDLLFSRGSVGRTDLPGGNEQELIHSLRKVLSLPTSTLVFPGHMEMTSIGEEALNLKGFVGQ